MSTTPGSHQSRFGETPAGQPGLPPVDAPRAPIRRIQPSRALIRTATFPAGLALRITGELDIASAAALERELASAATASSLVLLDLRETTFMDAAALGVIVRMDQHMREAGGRMILVPGSLAVRRLLSVSGMYGRLEIVDDPTRWEAGNAAGTHRPVNN